MRGSQPLKLRNGGTAYNSVETEGCTSPGCPPPIVGSVGAVGWPRTRLVTVGTVYTPNNEWVVHSFVRSFGPFGLRLVLSAD